MTYCNPRESPLTPMAVKRVKMLPYKVDDEDVVNVVSTCFDVSRGQILGKKRERIIYEARAACAYIMRICMGWPWSAIAEALGREHTSIMSAKSNVDFWIHSDEHFKNKLLEAVRILNFDTKKIV